MTRPVFVAALSTAVSLGAATLALSDNAATVTVCSSGCDHSSIQDAINAATSGDVISIQAGTYTGSATYQGGLSVQKALTLEGSGIASTTIDLRAAQNWGLHVGASNVVLRGFKVLGPQQNQSGNYGIKAEGISPTQKNTSLTIEDVTVENSWRTGVDVNGVSGVTLTNVTSTGAGRGRGVALTDVDNATLTNVTTSGNAWGGLVVGTYGRWFPRGSDNVSVVSLSASEANPLDIEAGNFATPTAPEAPTNLSLPTGSDAFAVLFPASGGFQRTSLIPARAGAVSYATAAAAGNPAIRETSDGSMHVVPGLSVQRAIDVAAANATVNVAAGTYTGNVNLNKAVRLVGEGTDASTGTVLTASSGSEVVALGASGTAGNPLALENLRISAVGRYGLNVTGTVAHVLLDRVHVVGNNPTDQTESTVGLKVSTAGTLTDLTIRDSRFADLQYGWYLAKHGSWTGGSTVDRVTVERTAFHHNGAKGIYAEKLSNATFTDVTVTDNGWHLGFFNAKWNAGIDVNLKGNDATYENLTFTNLTATGNALGAEEGTAVTVKARNDGATYGAYPATLTGVTFDGGSISGNERGLRLGEPGKANAGPANVAISGVSFLNNVSQWTSGAGIHRALMNESQAAVMAENNWWGSATESAFSGNIVNASTGSIDYDPWVGKVVATSTPVVNTPLTVSAVTFTFSSLPSNPQGLNLQFEPATPDQSSQGLPNPDGSIPGADEVLPLTLTVTSAMTNYTFRTSVTIDVSSIAGFGPDTRVAYYNTTTNMYVPVEGTYSAGPPATFTFETDHFTTFVFYNGSAADPMDLYVSRTTSVPAAGEEFVTPSGSWGDLGDGADDWTYTGQTATFNVVPAYPAGFGGLSSMSLVISYDPAVMTYSGASFHADWTFSQCQNGVPAAGRVTCDMSLMGATNEMTTTMAGAALSLGFTIAAPGYSHLDVIGADIRKLDGVGGYEGVAVTTHGGGVRNYLGDLIARTGASTTDATMGDGKVDFDDLTVFTQSYWAGVTGYAGAAMYYDKADVGPTTGAAARTVYGTPSLDRKIDFEDLVLFAASYGLSARDVYPTPARGEEEAAQAPVVVDAGEVRREGDFWVIPVTVSDVSALRGGSFLLDVPGVADGFRARMKGDLVGERDGLAFARAEAAGRIRVDAAVLGNEGLAGHGTLVELLVRAEASGVPSVVAADLRDAQGRVLDVVLGSAVSSEALVLPTELALEGLFPNPARVSASVKIAVPSAQAVTVRLYDALGREVMRVHDGDLAAGVHTLPVNTGDLANGRYLVRMQAGSFVRTASLTVVH